MKAPKQVKKTVTKKSARAKVAPALTLTPHVGRVKQGGEIKVAVAFAGLDEVAFAIEPRGAFSLDLNPMTKPGTLRLRGKLDGTATLVARGKVGAAEVVRHVLHLYCEGPTVRIVAFGYIPFEG